MKLIKLFSTVTMSIAFLAMSIPILPAQALTYAEIAGQGKVLGDSTTFYPYPTGTLVNDSGTIYFIAGTTKVPFTSWQAFVGLGYGSKAVVVGDLTNYTPSATYVISTANAAHPWGSWLIYKGTVYYSTQAGLIGVPSAEVFTSNGGDWTYIVKANSYDINVLNSNPNLPLLSVNDSRVMTTPTYQIGTPTTPDNATNTTINNPVNPNPTTTAYTSSQQSLSFNLSVGQTSSAYQAVTINSNNPNVTDITVTTTGSWVAYEQGGGLTNGGISQSRPVTLQPFANNISNMAAGAYNGSIVVTQDGAPMLTIPLTLTVNPASTQNSGGSSSDVPSAPVLATTGTSTVEQLVMVSRSPNGDNIFYTVDWGDNTTKGYYSALSGQIIAEAHTYAAVGTYTVTVSAATQNSAEISSTIQVIVSPASSNATNNSGATVSPTIVNITVGQGASSVPQPVTISWPGYVPVSGVSTNAVLFGGVSSNSLNWLGIANSNTGQGSSILDLPANGTFYVSVNAANLTTGTYSGTILINNIGGNVPAVSISIPVNVTVTSPSLNVSLNSALPSTLSIVPGSTNQKIASFQIANNSQSPAVVSSITLNITRNTIGSNFQNLKFMANASPSQIQIGATQPTISSNGIYTFTFSTPLIISAGAWTIMEAYADVASGVTNATSGVANQNLVSLNAINGTWQVNGAAINPIIPIAGQAISFPN